MPDDPKAAVPPAAPAAPAPPTPADSLNDLKKKLQQNQDDTATLSSQAAVLKDQVSGLQKLVDQNASAGKNYTDTAKGLSDQQKNLQDYADNKKTMLEATLKENAAAVVKAKQAGDQEITDLQKTVADLTKKVADDATAYATAQADTASQQAAYDKVAAIPSQARTWINDSSTLRTGAEAQKSQSRAYFHVLEMQDSLKKTVLPSADDFAKQLDDATSKLTVAKDTERAKKQGLDVDTSSLRQAQKALDDANAKRRDKTLKSIPEEAAAAG